MKYNDIRHKTKSVKIKDKIIGSDNDILIQSMTNTDTLNSNATLNQILELERAGCDIVRITVPNLESAKTISVIKEAGVKIPVVADIHFDYKIALECVKLGIDKIRINPGNIGEDWKVKEVTAACKSEGIPIRIGVNGGSLEKHILEKYGAPTSQALAESAFYHLDLLEKFGFYDSVISVKSSNVKNMIEANRIISSQCDYPIHLGVTEAGDSYTGLIKSSAGIGSLLCDGIGDTIRVSLTANPIDEIKAGRELLSSLGFYNKGTIQIVSCPTCGRTKIDLIDLSQRFKDAIKGFDTKGKNLKVALMGCVVNGPGEARECDVGIAGGRGSAVLFRHGVIIGKISEDDIIPTLLNEIKKLVTEK
ncbi:MAG: flavodoxin-dependent (E)-4-hydroxy-3-methylbut-2-enyl-diphosphate synthase [Ruminococcaceae bacterium]|nr:flavodoxin-dependent (E)-4-hydroxy-3-methylbut-2-enyl-diphosphate synthase [Oscillospiraceae bacterium]